MHKTIKRLSSLFIANILLFTSPIIQSANIMKSGSIQFSNTGPLVSLFSLSRPDFINFQDSKTYSFRQQLSVTNYISSTSKEDEQFLIDGETWFMLNTIGYQLSENLNVSVSIPVIKHAGGFADSFIYDFHDLFGLPQNGRRDNNEDKLRWILNKNGENLININESMSGLGDINITAYLSSPNTPSVMWSFMTKFPTGNYDDQTGSEKIDFGVSFSQMNPEWFQNRSFLDAHTLGFWYGAGISYLGRLSALDSLSQNQFVVSLRTGFGYAPNSQWHLKCQFDTHSPLYDSQIRELGWIPIQVSFSTWHKINHKSSFEFAIMEDIRPRSTPDVIFQTSYQIHF